MKTLNVNEILLPCTLQQFEDLTNSMLTDFNEIIAPQALGANYMAEIVMSAIHQLDRKVGVIDRQELLNMCINMVSKHVTYHAIQAMKDQMESQSLPQEKSEDPVS
jgi:hypothetical protein